MKCPKCKINLFINEWEGWRWECPCCDYRGRKATYKETEAQSRQVTKKMKSERWKMIDE